MDFFYNSQFAFSFSFCSLSFLSWCLLSFAVCFVMSKSWALMPSFFPASCISRHSRDNAKPKSMICLPKLREIRPRRIEIVLKGEAQYCPPRDCWHGGFICRTLYSRLYTKETEIVYFAQHSFPPSPQRVSLAERFSLRAGKIGKKQKSTSEKIPVTLCLVAKKK